MKQASFEGLYCSPLSSGNRCLVSYLNINIIRAKCRAGVRLQPGIPGSHKGQGWTKRDPFDQSLRPGNGPHMRRSKQFGGRFPPQLRLVFTPVVWWQRDPALPILQAPAQLSTAWQEEGSMRRKRAVKGGREALALSNFSSGKEKT